MTDEERPKFARGGIIPAEVAATADRPPPFLVGCYYALIPLPPEQPPAGERDED